MKKIIVPIISIGLIFSSMSPCFAKSDDLEVKNRDLYTQYMEKVQSNQRSRNVPNVETLIDKKNEMKAMIPNFNTTEFDALFKSISLNNKNIETIDSQNKNDLIVSTISQETETSSLFYMEAVQNQNEVLFIVDGTKYIIYTENEDVLMKSESGELLYLSKTEMISLPSEKLDQTVQGPITRANPTSTYPYPLVEDGKFTRDAGPGSKTNKELVKILGAISSIGGLSCAKVSATVGTILGIVGVGATVGDWVYTTFYIKFWQAYKRTDSSYWREKQRWFSDSGYNLHQVDKTKYFYNSRPD